MMTDYIKRDALLEARELAICAYENAGVFNADAIRNHLKPLLDAVVDTPAADVAEVVHGRWIWNEEGEIDWEQFYRCSNCGDKEYWESNYCPNCGAKMDLEEERWEMNCSRSSVR